MKLHKIIGNLTLGRSHPCYQNARLLLAEPQEQFILNGQPPTDPELLVIWDDLGAGLNQLVAVSDGAEAAQPFRPELKAVDAYCSAILDEVFLDESAIQKLKRSEI
jgi:microcompartment protein CcmK/EutM